MAPTAPNKRPTARQKALQRLANPTLPRKTHRPEAIVDDAFIESKKDKRLIKHSAFVSKITKPSTTRTLKRRRPNKKLVATLDSLGDALDEIVEDDDGDEGVKQEGKTRHKSLKSRPGALKKKEKLVRGEMERFGKSLAQLQQMTAQQQGGMDVEGEGPEGTQTETAPVPAVSATSNRWAALRGFISATMEQNPAFVGKT
jgi:hypothetical protein